MEHAVLLAGQRRWRVNSHAKRAPKRGAYRTLSITLPDHEAPRKVDLAIVQWSKGRELGLECLRMQPEALARLPGFAASARQARVPNTQEQGQRASHVS